MKQETLEEVAERISKEHYVDQSDYWAIGVDSFKRGAKWQQERMYSEEDMREAYMVGKHGGTTQVYYEFKEWFKQFKKKV